MGSLYRPKLKSGRPSTIWWVKYYVNGRPVRESTGMEKETAARRFLKEREGRVATGQPVLPRADKIRYQDTASDLRAYYRTTGRRDLVEAEKRLTHLDRFFASWRVAAIDPPAVTAYVERRQQEGAANGTINRELGVLSKMLRLAYENGKLVRVPVIRKLREAEPRSGFFEEEQFKAVRRRLPADLQAAITVAYTYGWRMRSEVLALERRHLDLEAGTLHLDPAMTKNGKGRIVYLTPEVKTLLSAQVDRVKVLERKLGRIIPHIFPHFSGAKVRAAATRGPVIGEKRHDFRRTWLTACAEARVPGKLRHDFRRTAARNLIRRGVPERVAMTITGHLTRSVFDRYNIVSPADLQDAARRLSDGHVFGHVQGNRQQVLPRK